MTYRERRLAKSARLREWAEKRSVKADAAYSSAYAVIDGIPAGQPILVGHHSERMHRNALANHDRRMSQVLEHTRKAEEMRSRAANILDAADHAIYSDDPDALERLTAKLAALEADRDSIKAYNASCRKGTPDASLLSKAALRELGDIREYAAFQLRSDGSLPPYVLSNLNGTISRTRKRLAMLTDKEAGR